MNWNYNTTEIAWWVLSLVLLWGASFFFQVDNRRLRGHFWGFRPTLQCTGIQWSWTAESMGLFDFFFGEYLKFCVFVDVTRSNKIQNNYIANCWRLHQRNPSINGYELGKWFRLSRYKPKTLNTQFTNTVVKFATFRTNILRGIWYLFHNSNLPTDF